ncbi:MAG: DUF1501 domain-containing protein [Verrucomicrobiales bacterium]|nr:DUF1501 domain-containing protein [Verrucomicrobiales bacterium]
MNLNQLSDLSRRQFAARAASTALGVGLLPVDRLFAVGEGASKARNPNAKAKNVIYLYMSGGMSHLDTFDPKPGSEVMGATTTLATKVDDYHVGSGLRRTAELMDRFAVINSMYSTQGAHEQGNYYMHTSYTLRGTIRHPAMGAWLLKYQGKGNPMLPGNVVIGDGSRHPGAGFFESKFSPLMINNPEQGLQNSVRKESVSETAFNRRLDMARHLDAPFHEAFPQKNVRAYRDLYDEALSLMKSEDLKAFDIASEPAAVRERYGDDNFGQGCLLARRLVQHGVRFVEVSLGRWDTHVNNFVEVPERCDILDRGLSALVQDLEANGMLEETLIVLASEFGRTPKINGNEGRDHYPKAFTTLLAGGGVKGGTVYGKTDENGADVVENKVSIPDLNATIGYALGLPLDQVLYSPGKRPFTVADKGQPVTALFG